MKIVLASGNAGKLKELRKLLAPLDAELISQSELGLEPGPETGCTFLENALAKARHASRQAGLPAIADDSGLVVAALGGAPGVHSARYAGEAADDAANNRKLIRALVGVAERRAFFHCALVCLKAPDDPAPLIALGQWHGEIVDRPLGENGFGYDPHFLLPELGLTSAQLKPVRKNALSHRGQATRQLADALARSVRPSASQAKKSL